MDAEEEKCIREEMTDVLLEIPVTFFVGQHKFIFRPFTLGKYLVAERIISSFNLDTHSMTEEVHNMAEEILHMCSHNDGKAKAARLIALSTFSRKSDILNGKCIGKRAKWLCKKLTAEEMAQLVIVLLSSDNTALYRKYLGITEDSERKTKISKFRSQNGDYVSFGGKSMWGTMIDFACERYGWTLGYVLWGISYANLIMMTSDIFTSVYINKDERNRLGIAGGTVIKADNPANRNAIIQLLKNS